MLITAEKVIRIRPKSKRNELFLLCLGGLLFVCSWILNLLLWDQYKIQLILIMSACLMVFFIGIVKYLEPAISYSLTPKAIRYYHRSGHWQLPWLDIVRIGEIYADLHGDHIQLPYLGVKVKNLENIASSISPRLANKLIHEQKELLILAVKNKEIALQDGIINFEPFYLNGLSYKGPVAAWLYRTEQLQRAYGYHLYLPESSFDREPIEFLRLLKLCLNYTQNASIC